MDDAVSAAHARIASRSAVPENLQQWFQMESSSVDAFILGNLHYFQGLHADPAHVVEGATYSLGVQRFILHYLNAAPRAPSLLRDDFLHLWIPVLEDVVCTPIARLQATVGDVLAEFCDYDAMYLDAALSRCAKTQSDDDLSPNGVLQRLWQTRPLSVLAALTPHLLGGPPAETRAWLQLELLIIVPFRAALPEAAPLVPHLSALIRLMPQHADLVSLLLLELAPLAPGALWVVLTDLLQALVGAPAPVPAFFAYLWVVLFALYPLESYTAFQRRDFDQRLLSMNLGSFLSPMDVQHASLAEIEERVHRTLLGEPPPLRENRSEMTLLERYFSYAILPLYWPRDHSEVRAFVMDHRMLVQDNLSVSSDVMSLQRVKKLQSEIEATLSHLVEQQRVDNHRVELTENYHFYWFRQEYMDGLTEQTEHNEARLRELEAAIERKQTEQKRLLNDRSLALLKWDEHQVTDTFRTLNHYNRCLSLSFSSEIQSGETVLESYESVLSLIIADLDNCRSHRIVGRFVPLSVRQTLHDLLKLLSERRQSYLASQHSIEQEVERCRQRITFLQNEITNTILNS